MQDVHDWLSTAAGWRWLSLLFQSPSQSNHDNIQALTEELPESFRDPARELVSIPLSEWEEEYHRVIGPGGIPACETSYDDNALAGRGPLLSRIAGFYKAFAYNPHEDSKETQDHISVELGFLSFLALKIAFAQHEGRKEDMQVVIDAYERFLNTHPMFWTERFSERVNNSGSVFYTAGVVWLNEWLNHH